MGKFPCGEEDSSRSLTSTPFQKVLRTAYIRGSGTRPIVRFQPHRFPFEWNYGHPKKEAVTGAPNLDSPPTPSSDEPTPIPPLRNVVLNNI